MSSVIIINGVPEGCRDSDIHRALLMYGTATDIAMHNMGNGQRAQAVVTMRSVGEAQAVLHQRSVSIQGSLVSVSPGAVRGVGHAANPNGMPPQAQQQQQHPHHHQQQMPVHSQRPYSSPNPYDGGRHPPMPSMHSQPYSSSGVPASSRLRVVVEDCRYPITREVLMQMFSMVAPPVHVYCGPSGAVTTGNVEYADAATAALAVQRFNNNAIYPDCCYVRLSYESPPQSQSPQLYQQQQQHHPQHNQQHLQPYQSPPPPHQMQQPPYGGRGGYGGPMPYDPYHAAPLPRSDPAMMDYAAPMSMPYGAPGPVPPLGRGGRGVGRGMATRGGGRGAMYGGFDPFGHNNAFAPPTYGGCGGGVPRMMPHEATVIVSNVAESVPLYDLWVLLEVYGNVNSLKRMYKGKSNVVAQFQNAMDAKTAVNYLNGCVFRQNTLGLKHFAGYMERGGRVEWNAGPATDPTTQAVLFTSGYHHRTKPSAPFNPLGRVRPDRNLFVSNLVEEISDEELGGIFAQAGCAMEEYYRKNPSVAIVSFADTDAAIRALVAVHATQVRDRYLRVTFSRYPPGPRPDGEPEEAEDTTASASRGDLVAGVPPRAVAAASGGAVPASAEAIAAPPVASV